MSNQEDRPVYKDWPALAAYIDRIGAEELSFKTFMVRIWRNHYYNEKCFIRLDITDGTISVTHPEYDPTDLERTTIAEETVRRTFPRPIGADDVNGLIRTLEARGERVTRSALFELWDRQAGKIWMVQRRKEVDTGKQYHPWTFFDDGIWRKMEPGDDLKFWKPRNKLSPYVMVHEGAKAARAMEWLLRSNELEAQQARKLHPWTQELEKYEHWGLIGGALAPHRADYAELRAERPQDVVYVADNDDPGRRVLNTFSRRYGGQMKWVKFDNRWPQAWDLADDFPAHFFVGEGERKYYKGPSLESLLSPATFATEMIPNPAGQGRPIAQLRATFAEEWFHSVQPELFVHRDHPSRLYSAQEFNSEVAPFSAVEDLARLVRKDAANKMRSVHYVPALSSGLSGTVERGQFINTYAPGPIIAREGDASPWIDYMSCLIQEDLDRHEVMRWCATLIDRPGTKMAYGLLLVSETQGVGKTTLGEKILGPLVGFENVSFPSESDIVDSQFNSWIAHKRLSIVNEIYAGNSNKAYNRLKSIITDRFITVNKKHQSTYELENWTHIFACSNSMRAIKIAMEDRRWLVPKVTEEARPHEYWVELNEWLENGGLEIIKHWAKVWLLDNRPVLPGETAPITQAKKEMIEEGFSRGQIVAKWLLEEMWKASRNANEEYFTTDVLICNEIRNRVYEGRLSPMLEKPATIRKIAKTVGLLEVGTERSRVFSPSGEMGRIIATDASLARRAHAGLEAEGRSPFDFGKVKEKL